MILEANNIRLRAFVWILFVILLGGCSTLNTSDHTEFSGPKYRIYHISSGDEITLESLFDNLMQFDIIAIGEQHDDLVGHQVQAQLVEALLEHSPRSAIAMEMFERDEQGIVELYLDSMIKKNTLLKITDASHWGDWETHYQPIVDVVAERRASGATIIASNSPKSYVTMARMEGFTPLKTLRSQGNRNFTVPDLSVDDATYKQKFIDLMSPSEAAGEKNSKKPTKESNTTTSAHGDGIDLEAFFRAQQVWDASMAESVAQASQAYDKVLLIAGDFHIASQGGALRRIRSLAPNKSVVAISIVVSSDMAEIKEADKERAEYVIYTRYSKQQ